MRLSAISTGYAIPCIDFNATVHSVFRDAVNLKLANECLLLTLLAASEDDLPQGIRLDTPEGFTFEQFSAGSEIFCQDNTLIFANSTLECEFQSGTRWQCDLPSLNTDLTEPALVEAWMRVWQFLNTCQVQQGAELVAQALLHPSDSMQPAISRRAGEAIHALVDASRIFQADDPSALTALIGLGGGLTPCGDDFLVGYLAGLWCASRDRLERRQFISRLGQLVVNLSGRTNDISRTYLHHAVHGQVSGRLDALARAISRPEVSEPLLAMAESAMESGHTSGMDAVTGLLFGLATWDGKSILAYN